jgi:hypothetical protein
VGANEPVEFVALLWLCEPGEVRDGFASGVCVGSFIDMFANLGCEKFSAFHDLKSRYSFAVFSLSALLLGDDRNASLLVAWAPRKSNLSICSLQSSSENFLCKLLGLSRPKVGWEVGLLWTESGL